MRSRKKPRPDRHEFSWAEGTQSFFIGQRIARGRASSRLLCARGALNARGSFEVEVVAWVALASPLFWQRVQCHDEDHSKLNDKNHFASLLFLTWITNRTRCRIGSCLRRS